MSADTIFARATAPGRAGIAVVRVSGPAAHDSLDHLTGKSARGREMRFVRLRDQASGLIDEGLALVFEGPNSFTGENIVEYQIHGSIAGVTRLLKELGEIKGFRLAEAGEFTRRALENGKLSLSEVEGLGDLIDAQTEEQRRQALGLYSGGLQERVAAWREMLLAALAHVVAIIDFSDEDLPDGLNDFVEAPLRDLLTELEKELEGYRFSERVRDGFLVVILGPPNVGKSTLLNFIAQRQVAITSTIPGTTRDAIEVNVDLDGLPVTFLDTAGLRAPVDEIEAQGIALASERAMTADAIIVLSDDLDWPVDSTSGQIFRRTPKSDLLETGLGISGVTGEGVPELLLEISDHLRSQMTGALSNRDRHQRCVLDTKSMVESALRMLTQPPTEFDLVGEELRGAELALSELVGRIGIEDVLGRVFTNFCVGK